MTRCKVLRPHLHATNRCRHGSAGVCPTGWTGMRRAVLLLLLVAGGGCGSDNSVDSGVQVDAVTIELRYTGPSYRGSFYSGFLPATDCAVWIETAAGEHVQTLMVTPTAVSVGAYPHVDHLPAWQASSGVTYADLEAETDNGVAPSFDGLTRASVLFEEAGADTTLTIRWELTAAAGAQTPAGQYRYCAEVANIHKDDAASYDIIAESTCGTVELAALTATDAAPTENIVELTATLEQATAK